MPMRAFYSARKSSFVKIIFRCEKDLFIFVKLKKEIVQNVHLIQDNTKCFIIAVRGNWAVIMRYNCIVSYCIITIVLYRIVLIQLYHIVLLLLYCIVLY